MSAPRERAVNPIAEPRCLDGGILPGAVAGYLVVAGTGLTPVV